MKRQLIYEGRASKWSVIYLMTFSMIIPVITTFVYGCISANAIISVVMAVLGVALYFLASGAARKAQYWSGRADNEQRFETIETLSSPRSHAVSKTQTEI